MLNGALQHTIEIPTNWETNLSRLVEKASQGESVVITKAGKPIVQIIAIDAQVPTKKKIGFLAGQITVPPAKTFNELGNIEITAMLGGSK
jgi:prevent-host-death family protein